MLIVITIMVALTALAATSVIPATEARRSREAARSLFVYLSSARSHAMETGRPCGVIFHRFGALACSMSIDQCEVPPCYCGETEQSYATLQMPAGTLVATLDSGLLPGLVRQGDLIQFNCQGPLYKITNPPDYPAAPATPEFVTNAVLQLAVADPSQNPLMPWTATASPPVPYRIFRSPMKAAVAPLQLPAGTVVDFDASGLDDGSPTVFTTSPVPYPANSDVKILFSPNGGVECYYVGSNRYPVTYPIFLLVGKRERVGNAAVAQTTANRSLWANFQDLDNIWVTINPQTGLISTDNLASGAMIAADARTLARDAQGMGGK